MSTGSFELEGDGVENPFAGSDEATDYAFTPFQDVKRALEGWQIIFIVISGTIGMGLFDNSGLILGIAGPSGAMLSYGLVAAGVICVMEGISEMVGHWPISNAMVEFVRSFVDEELAWVVGFAYWASYSISFATLIVGAANLAAYWHWPDFWQSLLFIFVLPLFLLILNCLGVKYYGNAESIAGVLKLVLVFVSFVVMLVVNAGVRGNPKIGSKNIQDLFQNNPAVAATPGIAALVGIPIAAYAYCGVEIVAVTAVEAKNPRSSLRFPAQWISYITSAIYLISVITFILNVSWTDIDLPGLVGRKVTTFVPPPVNNSTAILIIAVKEAGIDRLAGFLNACLILAILSAANTALYVSSRTLFGLAKEWPSDRWWHRVGTTHPRNKVPVWALLVSTFAFCWVPFLHLDGHYSDQDLQEIMSGIATVVVVLVWASQCLAFIRYFWWLSMHKSKLRGATFGVFNRWSSTNTSAPFSSHLAYIQPLPAIFGLVGCLLTVCVFSTSSWWNGLETGTSIAAVTVAPCTLLFFWVLLKIKNKHLKWGKLWVPLSDDWEVLKAELLRLNGLIYDDNDIEPQGMVTRILLDMKKGVKTVFNMPDNTLALAPPAAPGPAVMPGERAIEAELNEDVLP